MQLSKTKIAVTGASGFLGSHIAAGLVERRAEVVGVVRNMSKAAALTHPSQGRSGPLADVELRSADLADPEALQSAFAGCQVLVSNAALGGVPGSQGDGPEALAEYERVNVSGTENVMRAAASAGVQRVVAISTVAVYRTRLLVAMDEDTPGFDTSRRRFNWNDLTTDWRYAHTKTLAEQRAWALAAELGLELCVLRPGPIYGSRDPKLTARWLQQSERKLQVVPSVRVPFVHAGDVAGAVLGAVSNDQAVGQAYNLAGPAVSQSAVFDALARIRGYGPRQLVVPLPLSVRYDTSRAARDLGFVSRPLEAGLREVLGLAPA